MDATVRLEHSVLAVEAEHDLHAMVELSLPELEEREARPPLRVALALDRSGSMAGHKLAVALRCARWLAERLRPVDELALVTFDGHVRLLAPLARVDARHIRAALASVGPGGQTNLSGGWLRGLGELVDAPAEGVRKIVLLTDGLANQGITSREDLVSMARRARNEGVSTSTIGFGEGFDEDLLRDMMPLVGFISPTDPKMLSTVAAIEKELLVDGLVLRYRTEDEGVDGLPAGEGVFLACSFWLVEVLALQGRADEAEALFERLLALRNDVGLLAEEYEPRSGRQLGNFPQAFTHLALVEAAIALGEGRVIREAA